MGDGENQRGEEIDRRCVPKRKSRIFLDLSRHVLRCVPGSGHIGQGRIVLSTRQPIDVSSKARIFQGAEHPRCFVRGLIGRGHIVMAPVYSQ